MSRLQDTVTRQTEALSAAQAKVRELQEVTAVDKQKILPMQYELLKEQRDRESAQSRCRLLETELETRGADLFSSQQQLGGQVQELQTRLLITGGEAKSTAAALRALEVWCIDAIALRN